MRKGNMARNKLIISLAVIGLVFLFLPSASNAQKGEGPNATVGALEGEVDLTPDGVKDSGPLNRGGLIKPWDVTRTGTNAKVLLSWENGVASSLGAFSSVFMSVLDAQNGSVPELQITEGIVRVLTERDSGGPPLSVVTPVALVEQEQQDGPVDLIFEVYDPSSTIVTVLNGRIKVTNLSESNAKPVVAGPCQTVYVEKGKAKPEITTSSGENVSRLIAASTITGTLPGEPDICRTAVAQPEPSYPRPPEYYPPPDYFVDDWEDFDDFMFTDISILPPPHPGGVCVIIIPGIGKWVIPASAFAGWGFDPAAMQIFVKHIMFDKYMHHNQYLLADVRNRESQLRHMMYLAQIAGDRSAMANARAELDQVRVRRDWLGRRLHRVNETVGKLEDQQRKFGDRFPRGLYNNITASFNSPDNLRTAQTFRDQLRTDSTVRAQLAAVAGTQVNDLRSRIARERSPEKRLIMQNELANLRTNIAQGRLPIPADKSQLRTLVKDLSKAGDPTRQERAQKQLVTQLQRMPEARTAEVLTPDRIDSLSREVSKFPNAKKTPEFQRNASDLRRSVDERKHLETTTQKIENLAGQAAREQKPERRKELLGQLEQLTKPLQTTGPGTGAMGLFQQRQSLETQLSLEQDKAKRETLQKQLEESRAKQADIWKQQQEHLRLQTERAGREHEQGRRSDQLKRDQEEQLKPQTDRARQEQEQRQRSDQLKRQQEDQQKQQLERSKHEQDDSQRQSERLKHEQEQKQRPDQLKRDQEDQQTQQTDRARKEQEQRQRSDQLKRQQEDQQKQQLERSKHEQEERQRQSERLKHDQEQKQRPDQLKRDQEDQQTQQTDRARQEQEQKQRSDQLKRQQEDQQKQQLERSKHEQEERQRQSERLKHEQEQKQRSEQMRKQQEDQQRQQADRARQEQEQRQRSDQLRRQQEDQQKQQLERSKHEQEERQRQSERLKHEQDQKQRSEQMRKQQEDQQRQQADRARQEQEQRQRSDQLRRQQEDQQRQQLERSRHEQEQRSRQIEQQQRQQADQGRRSEEARRQAEQQQAEQARKLLEQPRR